MTKLRIGSNQVNAAYRGSTAISRIYAGADKVYPGIEFVSADNGGFTTQDDTIDLTGLGLLEDDVVYFWIAWESSTGSIITPSGWAVIAAGLEANDSLNTRGYLFRKVMGESPDSSVFIDTNFTGPGKVWSVVAFRGVDPTTPEDVTTVTATGTNTGIANPGSITPVTDGAWVVPFVATGISSGITGQDASDPDPPSGYSIASRSYVLNDAFLGVAYKELATAAAEDPGVFSYGTTGITNPALCWIAATVALRPA